jgi:Trk-type K+ transport system membrane component
MAVFAAVIFALQIAGFTEQWAVISLTAALVISGAIGFFILYRVITGIRQLETDFEAAWESERLLMAWKIMLAANAVGYALVLIAYLMLTGASPSDGAGLLITVGSLIAFAAGIYFLVRFYKTRQLYGLPDVYMY